MGDFFDDNDSILVTVIKCLAIGLLGIVVILTALDGLGIALAFAPLVALILAGWGLVVLFRKVFPKKPPVISPATRLPVVRIVGRPRR